MKTAINTVLNTKTHTTKTSLRTALCMMLCAISLFGCSSMRSDYKQPELAIPGTWSQTSLQGVNIKPQSEDEPKKSLTERPDKWWMLFEDSELNLLVDKVLLSNSDLAKATLSLKKARLEAGLSENGKIPTVNLSHGSSFEYDGDDNSSEISFDANLSLSYELDLWGRVGAVADSDEWTARASYEDRENTAQDLVVTTATLYWKIGYLNQMLALTKQNILGTERVAKLTKSKYDIGATTRLDVLESTKTLFAQQVQLSQLQQELAEAQNAISILLNQPLQDTGVTINQLPIAPIPDVGAGIPSDLLLRRPDIKLTLYALKASLASKDAVDASYMPKFELTSSLSTLSSDLFELLQNPVAKLGSTILLPFLEWDKMELNKNISELDYQMAVIVYKDTIYQAFEEVANLLTEKEHYFYQANVYKEQFINAQEIEAIYSSRYQNGASDIVDWINAMESRRSIESSVLENKYNQFVTQVKLYQSLGGGDIVPEI